MYHPGDKLLKPEKLSKWMYIAPPTVYHPGDKFFKTRKVVIVSVIYTVVYIIPGTRCTSSSKFALAGGRKKWL